MFLFGGERALGCLCKTRVPGQEQTGALPFSLTALLLCVAAPAPRQPTQCRAGPWGPVFQGEAPGEEHTACQEHSECPRTRVAAPLPIPDKKEHPRAGGRGRGQGPGAGGAEQTNVHLSSPHFQIVGYDVTRKLQSVKTHDGRGIFLLWER